jgi:hypothetical protein
MNLLKPNIPDISLSQTLVKSKIADVMDLGYEEQISYVGSSDSIFPSSVFATFVRNLGGSKKEHNHVSNCDVRKIILLLIFGKILCILVFIKFKA